jgi:2Fe-2S ferredoxin
MVKILFKTPDGDEHPVDIEPGYSLMDAAYNNGVPGVLAECGGAAACATCHVYIGQEWLLHTGTVLDNEDAMLFMANDRRPNSRLSCQIHISDEMDGMEVEIADNVY